MPYVRQFLPLHTPEGDATPLNSSPYVVSPADFLALADRWPGRSTWARLLLDERHHSGRFGIVVDAALVGGSFMDESVLCPRDIDAVLFYRSSGTVWVDGRGLSREQSRLKSLGVDARFIPLDGDPLILVRATAFFTMIYSKHRDSNTLTRGMILIDFASPM